LIGIYGIADVIVFMIQKPLNLLILALKGPFYLLGMVGSPSEDYIDVDYFTI